jgi:hypothetical protein
MPNPMNYAPNNKGQKKFMRDCMHTTLHREHKKFEQGQAQCLQMWRDRGKKKKKAELIPISDVIKKIVPK